uniref:Pentacotripeptide-repeat region of PRORP domain-containing protein n=1 Tax=Alexandrium monilatum TaxID=311494 RepID=A0A7S4VLP5_9DINO
MVLGGGSVSAGVGAGSLPGQRPQATRSGRRGRSKQADPELESLLSLGDEPTAAQVRRAVSPAFRAWAETPRAASAAFMGLAEGRRPGVMMLLLSCMRDQRIEVSYSAAISACAKAGEWRRAVMLHDDLLTRGGTPHVVSCTVAISACGKAGQWQRALLVLGGMPLRSLTPDVISCNAAISACEKAGRKRCALRLFGDLPARYRAPNVCQLQCRHQRLRRGRAMAARPPALQ